MDKAAKILSGIPEMSYGNPSPVCYIGSVMRLLAYIGDPIEHDELMALSGVGLCFPWKFDSDCDEVSIIHEIPMRTFAALGYASEYYTEEIRPDDSVPGRRVYSKEFYIEQIRRAIDAGRPVIGFGLVTDIYTCLITGYYDGGNGLCISSCQQQGSRTSDWYDKCRGILVVGEKTGERLTGKAAYKHLTDWAAWIRSARSCPVTANGITYPLGEAAFTAMGQWLLDDDAWQEMTSHEASLKQSGLLLVGYYRNNLFSYLKRLDAQYPGVVNPPVLAELERMSTHFPGRHVSDLWLNECVDPAITDFSMLRNRAIREKVARYVSNICECDNSIQWTLNGVLRTNMNITIKPLTPELSADYFDFFENRAFTDDSPYRCYCQMYQMTKEQAKAAFDNAEGRDPGRVSREVAERQIDSGILRGYLAFVDGVAIGWCNANDKANYPIESCTGARFHAPAEKREKAVVCFEIAPEFRGMGVATALLRQVVADAIAEGYIAVEGFPVVRGERYEWDSAGPIRLYERVGFYKAAEQGGFWVMRKELK